ncbi:MAG: prepilin peptidase [Oscillospiraceae bacterium]|nr:prepilin peptidase [Oscillospiraceae bacterium]
MDTLTVLMNILVFLFGIAVGSFLNVCILRIPLGESVVTGPSHCVSCGRKLKWYENIPLFSFLALRGRCSSCKEKISLQYPLVEALNGVLWLLSFHVLGFTADALIACLLVSALIVLSFIDARTREIPSGITIFILALGVLATLIDLQKWLLHIIGFFAVSLPLYLIFAATKGKGIGGGDIKLMAGCGLLLGWKLVVLGFFLGCFAGALIHLALMALKKADRTLSFGPYLSAGIFASLIWGTPLINWYVNMLLFSAPR